MCKTETLEKIETPTIPPMTERMKRYALICFGKGLGAAEVARNLRVLFPDHFEDCELSDDEIHQRTRNSLKQLKHRNPEAIQELQQASNGGNLEHLPELNIEYCVNLLRSWLENPPADATFSDQLKTIELLMKTMFTLRKDGIIKSDSFVGINLKKVTAEIDFLDKPAPNVVGHDDDVIDVDTTEDASP